DHGADHFRVLAHAEVVVGAPNHNVSRALGGMPHAVRKASSNAFEVGEDAVAPLGTQPRQRIGKKAVIIDVRPIVGLGHILSSYRWLRAQANKTDNSWTIVQ